MTDRAGAIPTPSDSPSDLGRDITECDREPIHIPGAIQPHGLLLVVDAASLEVVAGAGDIAAQLGPEWQGRPLGVLLGADVAGRLAAARDGASVVLEGLWTTRGVLDATAHRAGDHLLVELEPGSSSPRSAGEVLTALDASALTFERAGDLRELCQQAAIVFRQMTGYDRVLIYRFLDDDAGVVVAEDKAAGESSFLNHHFPASDIPRQARALYVRNRVRVIPDVRYTPAPIRPAGFEALDLSDVTLRSVSPIHVQYLKNMGVAASASVSIVKDGVLWGLIACHHREPKPIGAEVRVACRALAGGLARQIRAKEDAEAYRERIRLRTSEDTVLGRLGADFGLADFLAQAGEEMRQMMAADGFAAMQGKDVYATGGCPPREALIEIGLWARDRAVGQPYASAAFGSACPAAKPFAQIASGFMAATMSTEDPTVLMWFRAEHIQVLEWAGNPHKAANPGSQGGLTPRDSFAAWSEQVRGRAKPFTLVEVEAASRLRRSLFEARQVRRTRELNRELAATIADNQALLAQKDFLIGEVNHRVQNSLQMVSAFLSMQARSSGDAVLAGHLLEAQQRLQAVALVHRRLYSDDNMEAVDMARYVEDLVGELKGSLDAGWADAITLDLAPILVPADRAVNAGLILTELVINAGKYAYGGQAGPLSITVEPERNRFRLIVADRGGGKATATTGRQGFGSRMVTAMVETLGGTMEEQDNHPGLRVVVTAPVQPPER